MSQSPTSQDRETVIGYHGTKFMRSTYDPLPLPVVISFHNGDLIGPFCRHCGWRDEDHQKQTQACPAAPNGVIGPRCNCHKVENEYERRLRLAHKQTETSQ